MTWSAYSECWFLMTSLEAKGSQYQRFRLKWRLGPNW